MSDPFCHSAPTSNCFAWKLFDGWLVFALRLTCLITFVMVVCHNDFAWKSFFV